MAYIYLIYIEKKNKIMLILNFFCSKKMIKHTNIIIIIILKILNRCPIRLIYYYLNNLTDNNLLAFVQ